MYQEKLEKDDSKIRKLNRSKGVLLIIHIIGSIAITLALVILMATGGE
jgi:hypothetical protein